MEQATVIGGSRDDELNDLARRWQNGDTDAAAELYRHCRPELVRRMRRYAGDDADPEDLAQDVWLRVTNGLDGYDPERPLWHWLGRIARNHGVDTVRRRHTRVRQVGDLKLIETYPEETPDPSTSLHHRELIAQALEGLPARQRAAIVAAALLDHDPAAVAEQLGLTANGLRQLLHRSRAGMRTTLDRTGVSVRDLCLAPVIAIRRIRDVVNNVAVRGGNASTWPPIAAALAAVALATAIAPTQETIAPSADPTDDVTFTSVGPQQRSGSGGVAAVSTRHRVPRPPLPALGRGDAVEPGSAAVTPPLLRYAPVTLPNGTTITAGPDRQPDYAYGVEVDVAGERTHIVGQESYDEGRTSNDADAGVCHVFDQGLPGTYCRGNRVDTPPGS